MGSSEAAADLKSEIWYHGPISRIDAETLLVNVSLSNFSVVLYTFKGLGTPAARDCTFGGLSDF